MLTENVQIRLHKFAYSFGPSLVSHGIRVFFLCCSYVTVHVTYGTVHVSFINKDAEQSCCSIVFFHLVGLWVELHTLGCFPAIFTRVTTFVTSSLFPAHQTHSEDGYTLKGKQRSKVFPRADPDVLILMLTYW